MEASAHTIPQYFLHQRGIDVNRDIQNAYVGSQESSIMNAYLGKSVTGVTWPPPWRLFQRDHPADRDRARTRCTRVERAVFAPGRLVRSVSPPDALGDHPLRPREHGCRDEIGRADVVHD